MTYAAIASLCAVVVVLLLVIAVGQPAALEDYRQQTMAQATQIAVLQARVPATPTAIPCYAGTHVADCYP